jgi:hypothetical protein
MIGLTLSQLSLFLGEFVEALGDTLNLEWVIKGKLWSGKYCDAQGADPREVCLPDAEKISLSIHRNCGGDS